MQMPFERTLEIEGKATKARKQELQGPKEPKMINFQTLASQNAFLK